MPTSFPPRANPYLALHNIEFRYYLLMRMCGTLAIQMQAVVVAWQVFELTNQDPLALGLIGLTEAVPAILIALYAGHLVDSMSRQKIILRALGLLIGASAILGFFTLHISKWLVGSPILPIFGVIFLTGLARGFLAPAFFAWLTQIVRKEELPNAIAWNSTNWQVAAVAGPALGGVLYGYWGVGFTYLVQFVLMSGAFIFAWLIRRKPLPEHKAGEKLRERLFSGIRFVFGHQVILAAISLDLFAVLFGGAVALLPAFSAQILKAGPEGLGVLRAAQSLGSVPSALLLAYFPIRRHTGKILLTCVAGFGGCMILFAMSKYFWLSFFWLFLSGVFDSVSVVIRSNILQTYTPENMKGRVSAVNSIFISSSNEIGAFESGLAARLLGLIPSVIFGGVMTLLIVGFTAVKARKLRDLDG
ncbi:MAG: MFS transporter [Microscillaceae bacterium]|jgi:MFS family permease|nr:MFS transporter [Microscillaceae bacterium]